MSSETTTTRLQNGRSAGCSSYPGGLRREGRLATGALQARWRCCLGGGTVDSLHPSAWKVKLRSSETRRRVGVGAPTRHRAFLRRGRGHGLLGGRVQAWLDRRVEFVHLGSHSLWVGHVLELSLAVHRRPARPASLLALCALREVLELVGHA